MWQTDYSFHSIMMEISFFISCNDEKLFFFSRKFVPGNSDFKSAGIISSFLIIFSQILQYSSINKFLT